MQPHPTGCPNTSSGNMVRVWLTASNLVAAFRYEAYDGSTNLALPLNTLLFDMASVDRPHEHEDRSRWHTQSF